MTAELYLLSEWPGQSLIGGRRTLKQAQSLLRTMREWREGKQRGMIALGQAMCSSSLRRTRESRVLLVRLPQAGPHAFHSAH